MIKEVLNKMGIIRKGKANAGVEKAPVATPKQAKVQNKAFLDSNEISFIIAKMRQATYQGTEFELFYKVINKLQNELPNKK